MTLAKKATFVATLTAALLTIIKLTVGLFSGSVAILASAVDSILDMFVSIFNMFAVHNSEKPADDKFNYGRGKIEALASVIEGTVIFISGLFILYQAIKKALGNVETSYLNESIIVMIISFFITFSLVLFLNYVAKKTNSMVVKSDALHYKTDLWTNGAVLVSLVLINITGFGIIDSIIGGVIAIYIAYSAYELIEEGVLILLDRTLDEEINNKIISFIEVEPEVSAYHNLRTRGAGNNMFVDVHVVFHCLISLMEAHRAADRIEDKIRKLDKNAKWVINIHLDPYDDSVIHKVGCEPNNNKVGEK